MIVYEENLKESIKKNCWSDYNKVAGYKVNIQKKFFFIPAIHKWNLKSKTYNLN